MYLVAAHSESLERFVSPVETVKAIFKKRVEVGFFKGRLSMNLRRVCDLSRRLRRADFVRLEC